MDGAGALEYECTHLAQVSSELMVCLNTLIVGMVEKREGTLAFAKTFCFAAA